jgi:hypothetical protein
MSRAARILVSLAVALVVGIVAQLLLNAVLGHTPPAASIAIVWAYLIGGLPGLLLDPILLLIEASTFAILYKLLPRPPARE